MEKLSELSKPVGRFAFEPLEERWHHIKHGEKQNLEGGPWDLKKLYSQVYVSALLEDNEHLARDLVARNGEIEGLRKRAAELEAEITNIVDSHAETVAELRTKLATPVRLLGEMLLHDWEHRVERHATFQHRKIAWDARMAEDKKAILAAGFTFTVEGDEQ